MLDAGVAYAGLMIILRMLILERPEQPVLLVIKSASSICIVIQASSMLHVHDSNEAI